jgi:hypothetical protein
VASLEPRKCGSHSAVVGSVVPVGRGGVVVGASLVAVETRAPDRDPPVDAEVRAQPLDVSDEMSSGVRRQVSIGVTGQGWPRPHRRWSKMTDR